MDFSRAAILIAGRNAASLKATLDANLEGYGYELDITDAGALQCFASTVTERPDPLCRIIRIDLHPTRRYCDLRDDEGRYPSLEPGSVSRAAQDLRGGACAAVGRNGPDTPSIKQPIPRSPQDFVSKVTELLCAHPAPSEVFLRRLMPQWTAERTGNSDIDIQHDQPSLNA